MINHARMNKKSAIVTMLDFKNAFVEVEHNFIMNVLDYNHVLEQLKSIVREYYDDYVISIGTKDFITNPIVVKKGVLQGDCLSTPLFNMCFNTLLECIEDERIKCTGYVFSHLMTPRHWFQFADDSSIVTATEKDNQNLLNVFTKWCRRADFKIRIDKCCTFGIKKNGQKSSQFKPYLRISGQMIPCIEMGERFRYLEKYFSNEDITLPYSLTKPKNIRYDVHVETENPKKALKTKITNKIENHLNELKESNAIRSYMILNSGPSLLAQWKVVQRNLPENIFVFSRKALILYIRFDFIHVISVCYSTLFAWI